MEAILDWIIANPLIVIIILVVLYVILTYNNLNAKKQRVEKSFSTIDIYLEERFDKIGALLEQTMTAYQHEEEVYTKVSRLRTGITEAQEKGTINAKVEASNQIQNFLATPGIRTEAYPELRAITDLGMFTAKETSSVENELVAARKQYNQNVTSYNTKIKSFPALLIAGILGFKEPFELFKVSEGKKERPSLTADTAKLKAAETEIKIKEMQQAADAKAKIDAIANEAAEKAAKAALEATKEEPASSEETK